MENMKVDIEEYNKQAREEIKKKGRYIETIITVETGNYKPISIVKIEGAKATEIACMRDTLIGLANQLNTIPGVKQIKGSLSGEYFYTDLQQRSEDENE